MEYFFWVILIVGLYIFKKDIKKAIQNAFKNDNLRNRKMYPVQRAEYTKPQNTLSNIYYVTSLLTKPESAFYNILKYKCDLTNFTICPKVRLEDFINVYDIREKQSYRGRIKSRHVDFLICDRYLNPLCGIELDDNSHNSWKAQKADNFKNELYKAVGLKLYRVRTGSNFETQIDYIIHETQQKSTP